MQKNEQLLAKSNTQIIICLCKSLMVWLSMIFYMSVTNEAHSVILEKLFEYARTHAFLAGIVAYLSLWLCRNEKRVEENAKRIVDILIVIFSLTVLIGTYFRFNMHISMNMKTSWMLLILVMIGTFYLCKNVFVTIWNVFDQLSNYSNVGQIGNYVFDKNPIMKPMVIILLFWFPYYIVTYPGGVQWDAFSQLNQFYGIQQMTNHHPVFSTLIMGIFMQIGKILWNDNFGVFLYNIFQSLVLAYSFGLYFRVMSFLKTPYFLRWFSLLYYSLMAMWPSYAQLMIKDTLYVAIFNIYVYQIIWYILLNDKVITQRNSIKMGGIVLLLCLLRNNGFYVVLLTTLMAIITKIKFKKIYIVMPIIVYMFVVKIVIPYYGIEPGSKAEMLSIPFQQTARYVSNYREEISESEKKAINGVLDYENLSNLYNPELADPIKGTYKQDSTSSEFKEYLHVWWKEFLNHPTTYIMATLNGTYGYYSLEAEIKGKDDPYLIESNPTINTGAFDIHYTSPLFERGIGKLLDFSYFQMGIPVIGLFFNVGFYTWINIFLLAKLLYRKRMQGIVSLLPSLVTIMVCIASPVNTCLRYMLPVLAVTPLSIAFVLSKVSEQTTKEI